MMCSYKGFDFLKLTNWNSLFHLSFIIFFGLILSHIAEQRFKISLRLEFFGRFGIFYFEIVDLLLCLFFI